MPPPEIQPKTILATSHFHMLSKPTMLSLTEDEIDDLLYYSRANEIQEFEAQLRHLSGKYSVSQPYTILEAAVDPDNGNTTLHYACANGHLSSVTAILDTFPSTTSPSPVSQPPDSTNHTTSPPTPLPPFLNRPNIAGNTALHWAALNGHTSILTLLLSRGADPAVLNKAGHDALFEAERAGKGYAVEALLREGVGLETAVGGRREAGEDGEEGEERDGEMEAVVGSEEEGGEGVVDGVEEAVVDGRGGKGDVEMG